MRIQLGSRTTFVSTGSRSLGRNRPAVVLLHGAGMDHTAWSAQASFLSRNGRSILAPDLPGHGRSEGPPLVSIEAMARWVGRLLDAAGIERAALVGHSMGGLVALAAAAAMPARIERLALLGAAARMSVNPALMAAARSNGPAAAAMIVSWSFSRDVDPRLVGRVERLIARTAPGVLAADLAACDSYVGAEAAAVAIRCPTLLLLGAQDRMVRASGVSPLAEGIARAKTLTLPGTGHMMMLERPDDVSETLLGFLSLAEVNKGRAETAPPGRK